MVRRGAIQFASRADALEARTLLAGNVTAVVEGGNLRLTGDSADNSIEVTVVGGNLVVRGLEATMINGSSNPFVVRAGGATISGEFHAELGRGADTLRLTGPLTIGGETRIRDASGRSQIGLTNATLQGAVHIVTGQADDAVSLAGSTLGSSLSISAGEGDNLICVFDTTVDGDTTLSVGNHRQWQHRLSQRLLERLGRRHGRLPHISRREALIDGEDPGPLHGLPGRIVRRLGSRIPRGENQLVIEDSTLGVLRFFTGQGADNFIVQDSMIEGAVRGTTGWGDDFVMFDGATVTGTTGLDLGWGNDKLVTRNANTFDGRVAASGGAGRSDAQQTSAATAFNNGSRFIRFESQTLADAMIDRNKTRALAAAAALRETLNGLISGPDNTPPTTSGIDEITVSQDAADTVINLFSAFHDAEDPDDQLTFSLAANSNPALFSSTSIDASAGTLRLDYAAGAGGMANLTVRGTDTGGRFVDAQFKVTVVPQNQLFLTLDHSDNGGIASNDVWITDDPSFTIDVTTRPGATLQVDSDEDGQFDDGSATADGAGQAQLSVLLTHTETNQGANTIRVQARNDQNQSVTEEVHVHLAVGTVVRFQSTLGAWDVELFDDDAPHTVGIFLDDLSRYNGSIVHRNVDEFVIQGGGFIANGTAAVAGVESFPAPPNEFALASPRNRNERGTLSTAQTGSSIHSFTGQWFINTVDNDGSGSTSNLDNVPHTVFGRVIGSGMEVVDAINNTPVFNLSGIVSNPGAFALGQVPLINYTPGTVPALANYIRITSISTVLTPPGSANTFRVPENSPAGTIVGHVTRSATTGDPVIFQFDDTTQPAALRLQPDDHLQGNPAAPVVLIEYLSLQCPVCATAHPLIEQLLADNPDDLLLVRRHLPLDTATGGIFAHAFEAALAAEAAARQGKFDEMVAALFARQAEWTNSVTSQQAQALFEDIAANTPGLNLAQFLADMNDPLLAERINRDMATAATLGASITPAFFLNGLQTSATPTSADVHIAASLVDRTFALNRLTGQLTVADSMDLDFDTTPQFALDITASGVNSENIDVTVRLIDAFNG